MKLSFLYPDGITTKGALNGNEPNLGRIGVRTLYHLSLDKTFAELTPEEKNKVSHRAEALVLFNEKLREAGYADK